MAMTCKRDMRLPSEGFGNGLVGEKLPDLAAGVCRKAGRVERRDRTDAAATGLQGGHEGGRRAGDSIDGSQPRYDNTLAFHQ